MVHGINQQGKSERAIINEWVSTLANTLGGMHKLENLKTVAPFYGDFLFNETRRQREKGGFYNIDQSQLEFENDLTEEFLLSLSAQEQKAYMAISEEFSDKEKGLPHNKSLIKLVRALEEISPLKGKLMLTFVRQAYKYLSDNDVASHIDGLIKAELENGEETIIIAHSLGTIVTYNVLHELGSRANVTDYITLGSPLGLKSIKCKVGEHVRQADGSFPLEQRVRSTRFRCIGNKPQRQSLQRHK